MIIIATITASARVLKKTTSFYEILFHLTFMKFHTLKVYAMINEECIILKVNLVIKNLLKFYHSLYFW